MHNADRNTGGGHKLLNAFFQLLQPLTLRPHTNFQAEMIQCLIGQMMTFVENINGLFRSRQYRTAPQRQIGQHQIMVGHNHISIVHRIAGLIKGAVLKMWTTAVRTFTVRSGEMHPLIIGNLFSETITVAIPFATAVLLQ